MCFPGSSLKLEVLGPSETLLTHLGSILFPRGDYCNSDRTHITFSQHCLLLTIRDERLESRRQEQYTGETDRCPGDERCPQCLCINQAVVRGHGGVCSQLGSAEKRSPLSAPSTAPGSVVIDSVVSSVVMSQRGQAHLIVLNSTWCYCLTKNLESDERS